MKKWRPLIQLVGKDIWMIASPRYKYKINSDTHLSFFAGSYDLFQVLL